MGTDTMSDMRIRNVQRETFNSQLSMGGSKGCMVGGIWGQTRCLGDGGANRGTDTISGFLINGCKHRVFGRQATLVPATPGWTIIVRNRSFLRRFSDCKFGQFLGVCFPGSQ
jgi:hypothetical protein